MTIGGGRHPIARVDDAPHPALASETLVAVQALRSVSDRLSLHNVALPDPPESAIMVRALGAGDTSPAPPPGDFLDRLRRDLVAASNAGRIESASRKELRYAPWLLWNGDPPAASLGGLLTLLLNQARTSSAMLRRLIQAYLRDFDPLAPGIDDAAAGIRQMLPNSKARFDPWRYAHTEVHLFDPVRGPTHVADKLLTGEPPWEVLARYGLDEPLLATGAYMMAVEDAVRKGAPPMLRKNGVEGLERIQQIIAPDAKIRFQSRVSHTGRALLSAWLDGGSEPSAALRDAVRRILLNWIGDPRLRPQRWAGVGERETALMRGWVARASLDLFFKLIDEHALEGHWRYRHAFWLACLEKGAIADAWLALGSLAHGSAGAVRDLGRAYGRLRGPGVTANQSALLLQIGPLVFSEFTHNGKLRAWRADWPRCPQLGRQGYAKDDLTDECLPFPSNPYRGKGGNTSGTGLSHFNSHEGYWQGSAAALIGRHTGIKITPSDWRPR